MVQILEYIKNNVHISINILIGCAIIFIFVIAIIIEFKKKENFIHDVTVEVEAHNKDDITTIPIYSFTKKIAEKNENLTGKLINFSCEVDGKQYYLANIMVTDCKNKTTFMPDCDGSTVVLMDENVIEAGLSAYIEKLRDNEIMCISNPKITKKSFCKQPRLYIHDFKLTNVSTTINDNKYTIRGTSIPLLNGRHEHTLINQSIGQIHDSELICGGDYGYGMNTDENIYGEISIISKGTTNNLDDCVLKMKSYIVLKGVSGKPGVKVIENGVPKTTSTYLAVDKINKCNNFNRIKLVTDINDKDVLHFKVNIIS